jgi:hypothetical protein
VAGLTLRALNPFRIYGTDLPPGALLAAKLVALVFATQGLWRLTDPFVPYVSIFNHVGDPVRFQHILQGIWIVAAVALFVNLYPRVACGILGGTIGIALLSSDAYRTNNLTYTAILFLLIGLSTRATMFTIFRLQLVVLYGFAGANKLLDRGWRNGSFFDSWNTLQGYGHVYQRISNILPGRSFSAGASWGVIATEFLLMFLFAVPRLVPLGALGVIAYHSSLLFLTGSTFTMFWYALVATALALLWSPTKPPVATTEAGTTRTALRLIDLGGAFTWRRGRLALETAGTTYTGKEALVRIVALQPTLYALVYILLAAPQDPNRRWGAVVAFVGVAVGLIFRFRPSVPRDASPAPSRA